MLCVHMGGIPRVETAKEGAEMFLPAVLLFYLCGVFLCEETFRDGIHHYILHSLQS